MRSEAYLVQLALRTYQRVEKVCSSHRHVCVGESAPIACVLLGLVVTGKITTKWIILKTIIRFLVLRGVFQLSFQDYTRLKIALSQLMFCSALGGILT
jgi:hypothetical protein